MNRSELIENKEQWQEWFAGLERVRNCFIESKSRDEPSSYPCFGFYCEYEGNDCTLISIEYCCLSDFH